MSQGPYPRPFTYEECVRALAEALDGAAVMNRSAVVSGAYALSMAFNRKLSEVEADVRGAAKPKQKTAYWMGRTF